MRPMRPAMRDFAAVELPRDGGIGSRQALPWHLDWVRYKEYQITWSVARCARMSANAESRTYPSSMILPTSSARRST